MTGQATFERMLSAEMQTARLAGEHSFSGLLQSLAGTDPLTLLAFLQRQPADDLWSTNLIEQAIQRPPLLGAAYCEPRISCDILERPPHPLDYDWRFTRATIADLGRICDDRVTNSGITLFLGTPSLFNALRSEAHRSGRQSILIDRNAPKLSALEEKSGLSSISLNLCSQPLPASLQADVVVTDPPWYASEIRVFLWASACLCRPSGEVLACFPGLATRPGSARERRRILDWAARRLGLECVTVEKKRVRYESPPFEQNAWRAAGVFNIPNDWRVGDLVVFRRCPRTKPPAVRPISPRDGKWCSLQLDGVLFRLRACELRIFRDPSLIKLFPGDIFPSVSRRDPRRTKVDFWSAGNRVFGCRGPAILGCIVAALSARTAVIPMVERYLGRSLKPKQASLVRHAEDQVLKLVECEKHESLAPIDIE